MGVDAPKAHPAVWLIVAAVGSSARANTVTDQVIVSSTQATEANPRSTVFTEMLDASFDLGDDWTVGAGASLTLQGQTPAASRAQFGGSGGAVTLFSAAVDWSASDQVSIGATVDVSPQSTQYAGTPVTLRQANGTELNGDAEVSSQTSQIAGGIDVSWDSTGKSDLEWSFNAGLHFSHYDIDQRISRVRTDTGSTLTAQQLRQQTVAYCNAHPRIGNCGQGILRVLDSTPTALDDERFSVGATATLYRDTDVSLFAGWYLYDEDPAKIGYFGLAAIGRGPGLPIAPLQYQVRPEVQHRMGDFSARLWLEAGEYVSGTGDSTAGIGTRFQYRFSRAFRAWLTLSGQRDVDSGGHVTRSGSVAAGAGFRW
jgi:hypothetical protein